MLFATPTQSRRELEHALHAGAALAALNLAKVRPVDAYLVGYNFLAPAAAHTPRSPRAFSVGLRVAWSAWTWHTKHIYLMRNYPERKRLNRWSC